MCGPSPHISIVYGSFKFNERAQKPMICFLSRRNAHRTYDSASVLSIDSHIILSWLHDVTSCPLHTKYSNLNVSGMAFKIYVKLCLYALCSLSEPHNMRRSEWIHIGNW